MQGERKLSVVFWGTPDFAVPSLRALCEDSRFDVRAVVTQPDKPAGRGKNLTAPPLKVFAISRNISVFQPPSLKGTRIQTDTGRMASLVIPADEDLSNCFQREGAIDFFVTVAYGKILPRAIIDSPRHGVINVHASLLPRWRGAAPLQWAVFSGDATSGVSLMKTEEGLDTGPVYAMDSVPISNIETTGTLHDTLAALGAKMLVENLPRIASGSLEAMPQSEEGVTHARKWEVADCRILWSESAESVSQRIRASSPNPGARCRFREEDIKIFSPQVVTEGGKTAQAAPGTIVEIGATGLVVACGRGLLSIEEMQLPGKKRLRVDDVLRGYEIRRGEILH